MKMEEGLDTGPVIASHKLAIKCDDTGASLTEKLAKLASDQLKPCLVNYCQNYPKGAVKLYQQSNPDATYAPKLNKKEAVIDFSKEAVEYERQYRAFFPWLDLSFDWCGERIKIKQMELVCAGGMNEPYGTILSHDPLMVQCKAGVLRLLRLQRPSKAPQNAASLAHYYDMPDSIIG